MEFKSTNISGMIIIEPKVFGDERGFFKETFRQDLFLENGITHPFVQDNCSRSVGGTIRGLHYQLEHAQAKLVQVLRGTVLDVAVDIRKGSPSFGKVVTVELSDTNHRMVYLPRGLAHGFSVLSDEADFYYKCSDYYFPAGERGLRWDDPSLGIDWKVSNPILSPKDQNHPILEDIHEIELPTFEF